MTDNTIYPCSVFYSSPYDSNWCFNPQQNVDELYDSNEWMELGEHFSPSDCYSSSYDLKRWLEPELFQESCSNDCQVFDDYDKCNWYVKDLLNQLHSLQKVPSQSVINYLSEAKSLAYALNRTGEPIPEAELIECLVEGLDDSFSGFVQYYYLMNPSLSLDLFSNFLRSHEQLQGKRSVALPDHHSSPSSTLPQVHECIVGDSPTESLSSSTIIPNTEVNSSAQIIPPSISFFSPRVDNNESLSLI